MYTQDERAKVPPNIFLVEIQVDGN